MLRVNITDTTSFSINVVKFFLLLTLNIISSLGLLQKHHYSSASYVLSITGVSFLTLNDPINPENLTPTEFWAIYDR